MIDRGNSLRMGYVVKMFPRLSETFILNEILELERRGVEIVIFSVKKPNEGRFHPQLSRLKARVFYLEDLDTKKWASWIGKEWEDLSRHSENLWRLVGETLSRCDARRLEQVWLAAWLSCRARELGLQRLHAHFASLPSTMAYLANRISGIPFSFTAHAKDIFVYTPEENALREKIEAAEFMVTVTEFNRRYIADLLPGIEMNKIKVVHNGIDLEAFQPDPSIEREPDHVLGVGRLVPKKGFGDLLDACVLLRDQGVRFRCTIVGGGLEAEELERKRQALQLQDVVTFTGPLQADRVRNLFQKATIFCLPCTTGPDNNLDALPTVLLESLACGLPIVSTAVSGVPEIVESGVEGILVPPDDPEALSREIAELLASPESRESYASRGREKAVARFDQLKNVARLHDLFSGNHDQQEQGTLASIGRSGHPTQRNVLYLCTDKGIPFGGTKGASIHVREFLDALCAEGYSPVVAIRKRKNIDRRPPRFPVHVLETGERFGAGVRPILDEADEYSLNRSFLRQLESLGDGCRFDFVYERYSLFGIAGREFARRAGVPFILEVNSPLVEEASSYRDLRLAELAREIEKHLFSTSDHVVTVSAAVRDHVLNVAPGASVSVVPNGVDVGRFRSSRESGDWRTKVTNRSPEDFVLGFVGRVRPWHGVDVLIDALAEARKKDSRVRLCVVGDASGVEASLQEQCRTLGLDGAVTFLGAVPPADIPEAMGAMDAMVAPYPRLDSFYFSPLKVFEYMAGGKPIIASSIGQIEKVLQDETNALLVPPGDTGALCSAILRLSGDPSLRIRLGQAARETAAREHTWAHRIRQILPVIEQLTNRKAVEAI